MPILKKMFEKALAHNGETIHDVIVSSHPLEIITDILTLDEINCFYLMGASGYKIENAVDKQDMPYIAITEKYIYFYDGKTLIKNPDHDLSKSNFENGNKSYIEGVGSYRIDPLHLKRVDISSLYTYSPEQEPVLYPELTNMELTEEESELVKEMREKGMNDKEIIDTITEKRWQTRLKGRKKGELK